MKQQVNLYYSKAVKGDDSPLTALRMVKITGAFLGLMICYSVYQEVNHVLIEQELKDLETKQEVIQKEMQGKEALVNNKETKDKREKLTKEINAFEQEVQQGQMILNALSSVRTKKNNGFSSFMKSLASASMPEVWLTHFNIQESGTHLLMEGSTVDARTIPKLIVNLGKELPFKGRTFQVFKLLRDDKTQQTNFILQTDKSNGLEKGKNP